MDTLKKILKKKTTKGILIIILCLFTLGIFTVFVAGSFDNSSPQKAIAEYIYKETSNPMAFFIETDVQKEEYIPQVEGKDNYQYHYIVFNGIVGIPGDMGGTFQVSKVGNEYYVAKYLGYEGFS